MMENDYAIKVAEYPPLIGEYYPEDEYSASGPKMLRGPGQKASDPFQFVATRGGEEMAQTAKSTLQIAHQQKAQREKMLQGQKQQQKYEDSEPWQADLDTWRRKRKEKIVDKPDEEDTTKKNNENSAYFPPRKTKDEILQVREPHIPRQHSVSTASPLRSSSDDLNDSGIDNRTVETPSTSEFSPRSTDLFVSPKSTDEDPPLHAPPPPPVEEKLDQVLIPLKYSKYKEQQQKQAPVYQSAESRSYYDRRPSMDEGSHFESRRYIEKNIYMPVTNARVEATFKQPPAREGVKPFVSRTAQENEQRVENIDLTVELNREQKATVTATKYPRSDFIQESPNIAQPDYRLNSQSSPNVKSTSTTRIYHAVDIPFDESPATYHPQPRRNSEYYSSNSMKEGIFRLNVIMGSQPVHKGMGFAASKRENNRVIVDSVIVGSPADRAGLLVGDTILSINGDEMDDKYQSGISRILHEAARVGEADVLISRPPAPTPMLTHQLSASSASSSTFDKARSVFTEQKSVDSYAEFKRKHSRSSRDSTSTRSSRDYNSLPRGRNSPNIDRKRDTSLSSYRTAKDNFNSSRSSGRSEDYRVTSYQEPSAPGKLTDFVPEVDRRSRFDRNEEMYSRYRNEEEPKTIRNFHLSNENVAKTNMNYDARRDSEEEATTATLTRSTLPRNSGSASWKNTEYDVEKVPVKPSREPSPLRSALKKPAHNYPNGRKYYSTDSLVYSEDIEDSEDVERFYASMRRQKPANFPTVGSYGTRSRSVQRDDISGVSHRFYDRDGNRVGPRREKSTDIEIRREYGSRELEFSRDTYQWDYQESRDWRDVINQQRQAAPGNASDRRGIAATSASLSNLPSYINRRMESHREKELSAAQQREMYLPPQAGITEKYERDEYTRVEEHAYAPPVPTQRNLKREESIRTKEESSVVAVSGKHKCAHCNEELGRGAAMIVESLNLFYHLACFKCYVCKTSLGSGATGADVRVRDGRLHCQTCYSNDRVQLSRV